MATRTKTRRKAPARKRTITVQLVALGNRPVDVTVRRGSDLASFMGDNIPKSWNRSQYEARVNGLAKGEDYILNEGDQVTFAPHTAGGR